MPTHRSPSKQSLLRSGRVREVASDPSISRTMEEEENLMSGSSEQLNAGARNLIVATNETRLDPSSAPMSTLVTQMTEIETIVRDCENVAIDTMMMEQRQQEDRRGAQMQKIDERFMDEILDRLTAIEGRLRDEQRTEPTERRRNKATELERSKQAREHGARRRLDFESRAPNIGYNDVVVESQSEQHGNARDVKQNEMTYGVPKPEVNVPSDQNEGEQRRNDTHFNKMTVRLPRGGWLKNPFEDMKFTGRADAQNPMRFVNRFEKIADYEGVAQEDRIHYFGGTMRESAAVWFELHEPVTYAEAREMFLDHYWGDDEQARFRQSIYTGRYKPERGGTMAEYALEYARQARLLSSPMSEHEIIRAVKSHFHIDIAREIRATTVSNLKDLVKLLNSIESEKSQLRKSRTEEVREREITIMNSKAKTMKKQDERTIPYSKSLAYWSDGNAKAGNERERWEQRRRRWNGVENRATTEGGRKNANNEHEGWRSSRVAYGAKYDRRGGRDYRREDHRGMAFDRREYAKYGTREIAATRMRDGFANRKFDEQPGRERNYDDMEQRSNTRDIPRQLTTDQTKKNARRRTEGEPSADGRINILRLKNLTDELDEEMESEQRRNIGVRRTEMPIITMKMRNLEVDALVDTGAQISAITRATYDRMIEHGVSMNIIPIRKFTLKGAFSDRGNVVANKIRVTFASINKIFEHEFHIVERMAYEAIIGADFLQKFMVTVKCGKRYEYICEQRDNESSMISTGTETTVAALSVNEAEIELERILDEYEELFDGEIGRAKYYQHKIEITSTMPYKKRLYPVAEKYREAIAEYLRELERKDVVAKRPTQFINPLVVVMKKNGRIRMCLDARELNKRMANDHAQPPTIDEVFRRIGCKRYFTTLDVSDAFWQIPLEEESCKYTGFMFDGQSYVFRRMPFGLKTAGAAFTRAMNMALEDLNESAVIIYLDDVLIASESLQEHLRHIREVLERLRRAGFKLNKEKCEFLKQQISFLGHNFKQIRAEINDETRAAIEGFQQPRNRKAVQSFLGLVNWDRRFIPNLASLTKPLELLLRKGTKFRWTESESEAFRRIKLAFQEAEELYLARAGYRFGIYVDASTSGLGARLYQYSEEEPTNEYTVAYTSRSLRGAELNYSVTELECLALVWALRKWHTMLLGRHVRIHTDHRALQFLETCVTNNTRIARWFAFLKEFELEVVHIAGRDNAQADALSRMIGKRRDGETDADDDVRRIALIADPADGTDTETWIPMLRRAQQNDRELVRMAERRPDMVYERDGLYRVKDHEGEGDRIALPRRITWWVIERVHRLLMHFGTDKVIAFTGRMFCGYGIARIARDVVASCHTCIATKHYTRATEGAQYYELPKVPGGTISLDLFGPLPKTKNGARYLLVLMDQFSKYTKLYTMPDQTLDTITGVLSMQYFPEIGLPDKILTDNDSQFRTNRWRHFADESEFIAVKTSPYNPQSNPVERVMREIGRVMRAYVSDRHDTWDCVVPRMEQVINATVHASTGFAPDELHMNGEIELNVHPSLKPRGRAEMTRGQKISLARETLQRQADRRRRQFNKTNTAPQYCEDELVWCRLHRRSNASRGTTKKMHLIYDGPYRVRRIVRPNAYEIERLSDEIIGVYNNRQLRPHRTPKYRTDERESEEYFLDEDEQFENYVEEDDEPRINMIKIANEDSEQQEGVVDENSIPIGKYDQTMKQSRKNKDAGKSRKTKSPIEKGDDVRINLRGTKTRMPLSEMNRYALIENNEITNTYQLKQIVEPSRRKIRNEPEARMIHGQLESADDEGKSEHAGGRPESSKATRTKGGLMDGKQFTKMSQSWRDTYGSEEKTITEKNTEPAENPKSDETMQQDNKLKTHKLIISISKISNRIVNQTDVWKAQLEMNSTNKQTHVCGANERRRSNSIKVASEIIEKEKLKMSGEPCANRVIATDENRENHVRRMKLTRELTNKREAEVRRERDFEGVSDARNKIQTATRSFEVVSKEIASAMEPSRNYEREQRRVMAEEMEEKLAESERRMSARMHGYAERAEAYAERCRKLVEDQKIMEELEHREFPDINKSRIIRESGDQLERARERIKNLSARTRRTSDHVEIVAPDGTVRAEVEVKFAVKQFPTGPSSEDTFAVTYEYCGGEIRRSAVELKSNSVSERVTMAEEDPEEVWELREKNSKPTTSRNPWSRQRDTDIMSDNTVVLDDSVNDVGSGMEAADYDAELRASTPLAENEMPILERAEPASLEVESKIKRPGPSVVSVEIIMAPVIVSEDDDEQIPSDIQSPRCYGQASSSKAAGRSNDLDETMDVSIGAVDDTVADEERTDPRPRNISDSSSNDDDQMGKNQRESRVTKKPRARSANVNTERRGATAASSAPRTAKGRFRRRAYGRRMKKAQEDASGHASTSK